MWYSAIASALLGIGAAIITNDVGDSSSHRQRLSFEFDSKRTAFPGDVTCRLRPGEAFLNFGSRCDDPDDESRSVYQECDEPSGTHGRAGVMSLSDDASTCTLYPLESTDLQQHLTTPFCNQTQMDACAESVGALGAPVGFSPPYDDIEITTVIQPEIPRIVDIAGFDSKVEVDGDNMGPLDAPVGHPVKDTELRSFFREHEPIRVSPSKRPELTTTTGGWALRRDIASPHLGQDPKNGADLPRTAAPEAKKSPNLADISSRRAIPSTNTWKTKVQSAVKQTAAYSPTLPGSKHVTGMTAGLITVLLIFFIWL